MTVALLLAAIGAVLFYAWILFRISAFRVDRPDHHGYFGEPIQVFALHQLFRPELYTPKGQRLLPWLRFAVWLLALTGPFGFAALAGLIP